jgi:hypothetical protein
MTRKDNSALTTLGSELLSFLQSVDSPTIANAIENLKVRDRCEGYIGGSVRCMFPELGVMVGHALTVTMDSRPGPATGKAMAACGRHCFRHHGPASSS